MAIESVLVIQWQEEVWVVEKGRESDPMSESGEESGIKGGTGKGARYVREEEREKRGN